MRRPVQSLVFILLSAPLMAQENGTVSELKDAAIASIDSQRESLVNLSNQVWGFAETALGETQSAKLLADYAQEQGFAVERGVAGMPTAFIASFGEGKPIIGIVGEYDALPRLSQTATPEQLAIDKGLVHG